MTVVIDSPSDKFHVTTPSPDMELVPLILSLFPSLSVIVPVNEPSL